MSVAPKFPYEGPVKAYAWGSVWQIRDRLNRTIIEFKMIRGDLQYRKNNAVLLEIIAGLMNGTKWVENDGVTMKIYTFGSDVPEILPSDNGVNAIKPIVKPIETLTRQESKVIEEIKADASAVAASYDNEPEDDGEGENEDAAVIGGKKSKEVMEHVRRKPGRPKAVRA